MALATERHASRTPVPFPGTDGEHAAAVAGAEEQAKLEDDVVSHRAIGGIAHAQDVVGCEDEDGEVESLRRVEEPLEHAAIQLEEIEIAPAETVGHVLETGLRRSSQVQRFGR
jgi:hypothetical protein